MELPTLVATGSPSKYFELISNSEIEYGLRGDRRLAENIAKIINSAFTKQDSKTSSGK